jgi:hypothetical protein
VRLDAVTHSNNMEQRYIPLTFTNGPTGLTSTAPANANIAPPGFYMLLIIDANGVPSVASMVTLQGNSRPTVTLTQPSNGATFPAPAAVNLAATASDADGTVTKVEFFNGTTKLGEDTTAPYSFSWNNVGAGTYSLRARHRRSRRRHHEPGLHDHGQQPTATAQHPPTVSITYPVDPAIFTWKPSMTISASASDPDATVTKVEFRDGTTP